MYVIQYTCIYKDVHVHIQEGRVATWPRDHRSARRAKGEGCSTHPQRRCPEARVPCDANGNTSGWTPGTTRRNSMKMPQVGHMACDTPLPDGNSTRIGFLLPGGALRPITARRDPIFVSIRSCNSQPAPFGHRRAAGLSAPTRTTRRARPPGCNRH